MITPSIKIHLSILYHRTQKNAIPKAKNLTQKNAEIGVGIVIFNVYFASDDLLSVKLPKQDDPNGRPAVLYVKCINLQKEVDLFSLLVYNIEKNIWRF